MGKVRALAQSALSPLSRPNSSLLGRNSRLGAKEGRFPMGPRISSFSSTGIGVMTIGQLNDSSADNNNRRRAGTEGWRRFRWPVAGLDLFSERLSA